MSGSITESEVCASEFDESWTPQQGKVQGHYNFKWEPPWKNLNITIGLPNGHTSKHTSFLLVPIKMQFLMKHSLSKIQQIIHSTKCCQVDSINSCKEHLEIKVNSSAADEIFNEVENYLVNEVDEILLKPIQRFPYTSKLAEEYFKKGLKERSIDMLRDDSKIYIVGHSEQKDYINKGIHEINRVTVTKIVKIDEKWKIEAIKAFAFIDKLTGTFPDILARIQPGQSSIFLQGKDVTIEKAENEMKKLLSDLFNQNIQLDPLVLQLLTCKQASEILTCILEKDRIQVVWTIDKTQLCFLSKFIINVDVLKSILHEHFLTAGFSNSSQQSSSFCLSNAFLEITKMNEDKLLVFEKTRSGINIAATKQIILELLHREKMFYTDSRNTRGVQVDEVSIEIQNISQENKEIKKKSEGLQVRCRASEDRCYTLEKELRSEEEKSKRFALEKHVLEETNRDMNSKTTKQLNEFRDLCDVQNSKSISQQNEIESLKTTNEKLADNLKIVHDDKTKQEEKYKLKIPNTDAAVNIQAKLNISGNVFLVESKQRIRNLKRQSGLDVYTEDDGTITLVGNLRSISLSLDKLLQWTNETPDVKLAAERQHIRDLNSSSQKRSLEKGGKSNNVSGASGGCQYPGHMMYPNIFTESGNMIDEQNMQSKEPISSPLDSFKDLKYFPAVDDDSLMMTTTEGIKVYVYQGNLCYLNVRGIVSSSNEYMNHSSGLLSVIEKEAGEKMINECQGYLENNTKLFQGKVCVTTPGNLKHYTCILHACAPVWANRKDTDSYIEGLMTVIRNAIISANDIKLRSIAIPAIGSDGRGGPKQICFSSFPRAITQYSSKYGKTSSIQAIHFVDQDHEVVTLMQTAFILALDESRRAKDSKFKNIPLMIRNTFFSYTGSEFGHTKYQILAMSNNVNVVLCDGQLFSAPRHKHGENMSVEEDDAGVVITIDEHQTGKSRSASLCLQRCGNDFHWNYNKIKKLKKSIGESYETFGDKQLKFGSVIFLVMPTLTTKALDKTSAAQRQFQSLFHQCCAKMLIKADNCNIKHLAVPVIVDDFYDFTEDWFVRSCTNIMMVELHNFAKTRKKTSSITVHFAGKNENLYQICKTSLSSLASPEKV
ncbi:uncharacterized protein [Mytilus edulis]|uniref:uncharacterized protein n=1 Tax=Mytilus edulis TaxID=6550 RepID=UPI0039EFC400